MGKGGAKKVSVASLERIGIRFGAALCFNTFCLDRQRDRKFCPLSRFRNHLYFSPVLFNYLVSFR